LIPEIEKTNKFGNLKEKEVAFLIKENLRLFPVFEKLYMIYPLSSILTGANGRRAERL